MGALKIIIDTNVLYSGLYSSEGASFQVLDKMYYGLVVPVISIPLVFEYEEILKRKIDSLNLTEEEIDKLLDNICEIGEPHKISFLWRPYLNDPKDDHILELAVASKPNSIVTHNIKNFRGSEDFDVKVQSPKQFLESLK